MAQLSTQQTHPWRAVARTVLAYLVPLAIAAPAIVGAITAADPAAATGFLGGVVVASGIVTRVMAVPAVDQLLSRLGLGSMPAAALTSRRADVDEHQADDVDEHQALDADAGIRFGVWP